ncbi:MAG: hypothetical protein R3178_05750 [Rhodothermales bacterium]|nr:hypothetical protein [Rhodothermales bacterium]
MTDKPDRARIYDEKAVSAILKRASQLQAKSNEDGGFGLSLTELKQIAADAGIDPRFVALAATEFIYPEEPEANWWGGPLSHSIEWTIDGEIDDIAWEEIVAEIRRHFKDTGEVRSWSNSHEWAHSGRNAIQAHLTATAREGMTRLSLFWAEPTLAVAAYIPLLVLSLIMLPIVFEALALSGLAGALAWFTGFGVLFTLARWFLSHLSSGKRRDLTELKGRLERIASEMAAPPESLEAAPPASEPRPRLYLDLDEGESEDRGYRGRAREKS